jgi:hypothetical protein
MSPHLMAHKIINYNEFDLYAKEYTIIDYLDFLNGKILITYNPVKDTEEPSDVRPPKVSVAIASAITAYSRIKMTPYIMNYQNIIHSIDTDGVKYSGEIDSNLIGPELGK